MAEIAVIAAKTGIRFWGDYSLEKRMNPVLKIEIVPAGTTNGEAKTNGVMHVNGEAHCNGVEA